MARSRARTEKLKTVARRLWDALDLGLAFLGWPGSILQAALIVVLLPFAYVAYSIQRSRAGERPGSAVDSRPCNR
ncbi:MAG: hypothetical protein H6718_13750 [Polyangiaceae bacterium]|nr:hypothetical protein [Polyangiaceae bacterium]MCB9605968.1 hypothetical protein [Polyangiaceae bacterium]